MYRAAVIYAPEEDRVRTVAQAAAAALDARGVRVTLKEAVNAGIPDLTASDLIFLGCCSDDVGPIHHEFAEMVRALSGVNLAGRVAGVFGVDSPQTPRAFREALRDSEVTLEGGAELAVQGPADPARIAAWADGLTSRLEELLNGR